MHRPIGIFVYYIHYLGIKTHDIKFVDWKRIPEKSADEGLKSKHLPIA